MYTVLVAEDESEIRNYLKLALSIHGLRVEFAQSGEEAVALVAEKQQHYCLVLLDIFMPIRDGLDSLKAIRDICPGIPVIMMSGAATPSNVIAAMTNGAQDFLAKPIGHEDLKRAVEKVLKLTLPIQAPQAPVTPSTNVEGGDAFAGAWWQKMAILLERVACSDVPVLLQGETGVGKEVVGRQLHARSRRSARPFLKLNCAALPSELVESELFGYEKGAFTGAFKSTPGKFEMANGGTILLDEIGDMDVKLQAKLLQVLQDREFHRLGAKEMSRVDVRIMAASHCDFDKAIREGRFREDLFYRLNIIDIHIPALRERRDEILPLAEFFMKKYASADSPYLELSPSLKQTLLEHTWPGNVRELENVMQKYLVLRNPELLTHEIRSRQRKGNTAKASVPQPIVNGPTATENRPAASEDRQHAHVWQADTLSTNDLVSSSRIPAQSATVVPVPPVLAKGTAPASVLADVQDAHRAAEAEAIIAALNSSLWNRKQAASLLNIDYKALLYKMKKLGIGAKDNAGLVPGQPAYSGLIQPPSR